MSCPFCNYDGPHIHFDGGVVSPETWRLREDLLQQVKGERDRMIARTIELGTELDKALEFVERLRDERETLRAELDGYKQGARVEAEEADSLRAQLAERDALIRRALFSEVNDGYVDAMSAREELRAALSASAEPSVSNVRP